MTKEENAELNIHQKLAKIRNMCEVMTKNKNGYSYKYVSIDEILARVTAGMKKYHLSLIPSVDAGSVTVTPHHYIKTKTTRDGKVYEEHTNEIIVSGGITYTWVNNNNPEEKIEVPWFITGAQIDPSQALGSAMTYCLRYFLIQYFQISTPDDDPDNWRSKQRESELSEEKEIVEAIVNKIAAIAEKILADSPDERDNVIKITKRYVREKGKPSANFFIIKDLETATSLLNALTKTYNIKEEEE